MTQTITPLRRRMLDDMRLRNMADGTSGKLTETRGFRQCEREVE